MMKGTAQVLRFNWPLYAAGAAAVIGGMLIALLAPAPWCWLGMLGMAIAGWFSIASLVAAWWAYDSGGLYGFAWLAKRIGSPAHWCALHAGLDEATPCLRPLLTGECRVFDIHRATATEPSLARARGKQPAHGEAIGAGPLPLPDGWADAVVLAFVVHELRSHAERVELLRDIHRVLAPGGRAWLVEQCRDLPNVIAYGPGAWHFHTHAAWLRAISDAGLQVSADERLNPFIRCFTLGR